MTIFGIFGGAVMWATHRFKVRFQFSFTDRKSHDVFELT